MNWSELEKDIEEKKRPIAIIGIGYVGLPLAMAFSKHIKVIAFDINKKRIEDYNKGIDPTGDFTAEQLKGSNILFTTSQEDIRNLDVYIITVPTPVTENKIPDVSPLEKASSLIAPLLKRNSIVVYESTVYPGLTEEICLPILEKGSKLELNKDFFLGYSPERIRPGDKKYTVETISKVVSGSNSETTDFLFKLYSKIVKAEVFKASSIKVAEASKIVENVQRDVIIGLMNELGMLFNRMEIPFNDVLEAAGTKWDFIRLTPGFVGGHCISVDPYYLSYKAKEIEFDTKMLLSARATNDEMPIFMAHKFVKELLKETGKAKKIGIIGFTFKENCPDIRNTQVIRLIKEIQEFGCEIIVYDPLASHEEVKEEYGITLNTLSEFKDLDGIFIAVPHQEIKTISPSTWASFFKEKPFIFDFKKALNKEELVNNNFIYKFL